MQTAEEEHELLTQTGPGTPCGELMRRYWQPVALSEELPAGGSPLPIRLLGEDLVLFRDDQGRPGLLGIHCSHRGADLSYGRLEDGGLRCIYHGWLYDVHGRCLEQPGEPAGQAGLATERGNASDSPLLAAGPARCHERIRHPAYPCVERARTIFAYLGPGEPALFPNYEFLGVPDGQVSASKLYHECNYLQADEGNIDLSHLSFLHYTNRVARRGETPDTPVSPTPLSPQGAAPGLESSDVELTPYGLRSFRISRDVGPNQYRFDTTEFVLPNFTAYWGGPNGDRTGRAGYSVNWHVPIDDTHHWKFNFHFGRHEMADEWGGRGRAAYPDRNKSNRYLQDRASMVSEAYTGIGTNFFIHDKWATEGQGPVQDWSQEHLGAMDRAVVIHRKVLLKAIQDLQRGQEPANVVRDPERNFFPIASCYVTVPNSTNWRQHTRALEAAVPVGSGSRAPA